MKTPDIPHFGILHASQGVPCPKQYWFGMAIYNSVEDEKLEVRAIIDVWQRCDIISFKYFSFYKHELILLYF